MNLLKENYTYFVNLQIFWSFHILRTRMFYELYVPIMYNNSIYVFLQTNDTFKQCFSLHGKVLSC